MKYFVKKMMVLLMTGILIFSVAGCGSVYTSSRYEEDDNDEEEYDKSSEKEDEKSSSKNADGITTDVLTPEDEAIIDELLQCMTVLADIGELSDSEILDTIDGALQSVNSLRLSGCSEPVKNLVAETTLVLQQYTKLYELSSSYTLFAESLENVSFDGLLDITENSTMDEISASYDSIDVTITQLNALEVPQSCEHILGELVSVLESYRAVLFDMYFACKNDDYLGKYSNLCFCEELLAELEDICSDVSNMSTDVIDHLSVLSDRLFNMEDELSNNLIAASEGRLGDLQFSYLEEDNTLTASVECIDAIYPALYNRMDAVSILTLSCPQDALDVLVTVEVDGFSQKYEQTMTLGVLPQRLYVKPPVLSSGLNLDNQKNTQIKVTVSDLKSGNTLLAETSNVKIMSINDFILTNDEYGYSNRADILAWVTPESAYIQDVLRLAAAHMKENTGYEGIPGYQRTLDMSDANITANQVFAIQQAISDLGVRYVMSSYSIGEAESATQRVNRPDETLKSQSGICIETAVLMASALQAAEFDSMIVFTTGHAQVAVETWANSGEYILIETTVLPTGTLQEDARSVVTLYTDKEWKAYLSERNGTVYSCNMATNLGITPLIY